MKLFLTIWILGLVSLNANSELEFFEAIKQGNTAKVLKLANENRGLLQAKDSLERSPALLAVIHQKEDLSIELIKLDSNLAYSTDVSKQPLFLYACEFGQTKLVNYLVDSYLVQPAQVQNLENENCLTLAKRKGHYDIVHKMESLGLQSNQYTQTGVAVAYIVYLIISLITTVWVARILHKNGRVFLVDSLKKENLADSVNHLLVVGFYLVNFGFIAFALKISNKPKTAIEATEILSQKIGLVLVVLGIMHFFNLFMFGRLKKKTAHNEAN